MNWILAQVATHPDFEVAQHVAPVANDVDWWVIGLDIACSTAVFTFGIARVVRYAIKGHPKEKLLEVGMRLALTLVSAGLGAIAGWRVWDVWLGGLMGLIGSGAAPTLVTILLKFVGRRLDNTEKPSEE